MIPLPDLNSATLGLDDRAGLRSILHRGSRGNLGKYLERIEKAMEARRVAISRCRCCCCSSGGFIIGAPPRGKRKEKRKRRREKGEMTRGETMVELDFFRIEKENAARFRGVDRRGSVRGIESVISGINPRLLRTMIAPGAAWRAAAPPLSAETTLFFPSPSPSTMPALNPSFRSIGETSKGTPPLTIFYNGMVAVFDLPREKAEVILKLAEEGDARNVHAGDLLPMARRKSLLRFLEKRKQRLTAVGPYTKDVEEVGSGKKATSDPISASSL